MIKYGTKEIERRAIEMKCVNHMVYFSLKIGTDTYTSDSFPDSRFNSAQKASCLKRN